MSGYSLYPIGPSPGCLRGPSSVGHPRDDTPLYEHTHPWTHPPQPEMMRRNHSVGFAPLPQPAWDGARYTEDRFGVEYEKYPVEFTPRMAREHDDYKAMQAETARSRRAYLDAKDGNDRNASDYASRWREDAQNYSFARTSFDLRYPCSAEEAFGTSSKQGHRQQANNAFSNFREAALIERAAQNRAQRIFRDNSPGRSSARRSERNRRRCEHHDPFGNDDDEEIGGWLGY